MRGFNYKKATQSLNFFSIKEGGTINKMKSIKLVWLADRLHLRTHARTITGDSYFAMKNGPVPSSTRDILEQNDIALSDDELQYSAQFISITDKFTFSSKENIDTNVFSQTDLEALDAISNLYGKYTKYKLRDLSHEFPEWKKFQSALENKVSSRFPMNELDFFFDAPKDADLFDNQPEIVNLSKEVYLEHSQVTNYFR